MKAKRLAIILLLYIKSGLFLSGQDVKRRPQASCTTAEAWSGTTEVHATSRGVLGVLVVLGISLADPVACFSSAGWIRRIERGHALELSFDWFLPGQSQTRCMATTEAGVINEPPSVLSPTYLRLGGPPL
jgi:hypothetical protein